MNNVDRAPGVKLVTDRDVQAQLAKVERVAETSAALVQEPRNADGSTQVNRGAF